jgi:phage terminase large subunit
MAYQKTTATNKILQMKKRIRAVQGGTSASKTISILLYLIAMAQTDKNPTLTSIVSESFPHLKRGVMRDFILIMEAQGYWKDDLWNKTDSVYKFETGSKIEFFSADQPDKLRGARRDRLFINEANNVPFEAFNQLEVRTKEFCFLDWNPTNEFWFYSEICSCGKNGCSGTRTDAEHIILTYKDNEALDAEIVKSIEQRRGNVSWFKVYGEGQLGEVEGKIYKDWKIINDVPHEARLERYGLDFGYSNDPTAIVAIYRYNDGFIIDEIAFQKELSNKMIADIIQNQPAKALVVADSAEPKSIDEVALHGVNIVGVSKTRQETKSETFVKWAISVVQDQRISVTKRSTNVIKEYRNFLWKTDRDGKILNEPEHEFKHSMDAIAYAFTTIAKLYTSMTPKEREDMLFRKAMQRKGKLTPKSKKHLFISPK